MKLEKHLNLLDVFCISTGSMLTGIFILPGMAYAIAGPAVMLALILAALIALMGLFSQAELVSAMPKAGGAYFYVNRCMGPAIGTIYGLITWISLALKSAYALQAMAIFVVALIPSCNALLFAGVLCVVFVVINLMGAKGAGHIQSIMVFVVLTALLLYIFTNISHVNLNRFGPFIPHGFESVATAASFIFITFAGILKIASMGEEVKNPALTIPVGMMISFLVITTFFVFILYITVGILPAGTLSGHLTPLSAGAVLGMGGIGRVLLSVAAIIAAVSVANAGIMAASRYPLALARDHLFPKIFGRLHATKKTPHVSLIATGLIILAALFAEISVVIKATSAVLILTYMFASVSIIILRESKIQNYQPRFKTPFYPWIQIIGILGSGFLLYEIGIEALFLTLFLFVIGLLIYKMYGGIKTGGEFALMHLIERITARELTGHLLETELKEIVRERDDIQKDRFDHLIEECPVLDLEGPMGADEFFSLAAETISKRIHVKSDVIQKLLLEREGESTTALNPDLAIPHIIIKGEKLFDILLVRCREGIRFSDEAPSVHSVFVLIGSRDERSFHLRSLAAIAQIVQDPEFEQKWEDAKSEEVLRDIILLGPRRRHG